MVKSKTNKRIALLFIAEILLLGVLWWGVRRQMRAMDRSVNDISELKDPSPFRAALMGHLGKIRLGLQGYLGSGNPALADQVVQSRKDFYASLPEFQKENARLFPKAAVEEILKNFDGYKQGVDRTLEASAKRQKTRDALDQNFARILFLLERNIKPLIRDDQGEAEERREAVLNIENQARAWQQNLLKVWAQPDQRAIELTFENDNRGSSFLERYAGLELMSREKKVLKEVRALWQSNSDLARESIALEKVVVETLALADAQRELVVSALNRFLPAMPPTEFQARKQGYTNALRVRFGVLFLIGLIAFTSLAGVSLASYRMMKGVPLLPERKPAPKPAPAPIEPTLQMDLKGLIAGWSAAAEKLYGYTAQEMQGQPISKLFESEEEIARLYKDLLNAPNTTFETTHKAKNSSFFRVKIQFLPMADSAGKTSLIGLICTHK
jgi:PAS domain S-box-containing protein